MATIKELWALDKKELETQRKHYEEVLKIEYELCRKSGATVMAKRRLIQSQNNLIKVYKVIERRNWPK